MPDRDGRAPRRRRLRDRLGAFDFGGVSFRVAPVMARAVRFLLRHPLYGLLVAAAVFGPLAWAVQRGAGLSPIVLLGYLSAFWMQAAVAWRVERWAAGRPAGLGATGVRTVRAALVGLPAALVAAASALVASPLVVAGLLSNPRMARWARWQDVERASLGRRFAVTGVPLTLAPAAAAAGGGGLARIIREQG